MDSTPYRIIIAPLAIEDLEEITTYIAADNPAAAERFGRALLEQVKPLATFPELGRVVPELPFSLGAREIVFRSYRIVYHVDHARRVIGVARFWHAARGTPEL